MINKVFQDRQGRVYKHYIAEGDKKAIICRKGINKLFNGTFKLVSREGDSVFGDEVIVEFLMKGLEKEYSANSNHECVEIYLKKEEAIELLEGMLKQLKGGESI